MPLQGHGHLPPVRARTGDDRCWLYEDPYPEVSEIGRLRRPLPGCGRRSHRPSASCGVRSVIPGEGRSPVECRRHAGGLRRRTAGTQPIQSVGATAAPGTSWTGANSSARRSWPASKTFPRHAVRTAHVIFCAGRGRRTPLALRRRRRARGADVRLGCCGVVEGDRQCASVTVLLDTEQDSVIAHASPMPDVGSPVAAMPVDMPMVGP